ncbi:MAG: TlpA family protein disulfide reductase [Thermoguttaceae bacterium]
MLFRILCAVSAAVFFSASLAAQVALSPAVDIAQQAKLLDKIVNDNAATFKRTAMIPLDKPILESAVNTSTAILSQPNISAALRDFTLKRRGKALVLLTKGDPASPYHAELANFIATANQSNDAELKSIVRDATVVALNLKIKRLSDNVGSVTESDVTAIKDALCELLTESPGRESDWLVERFVDVSSRFPAPMRGKWQAAIGEAFGAIYLRSKDPRDHALGEQYTGMARRAQLPGQEMKLEGFLADGKPFDPQTLRGKIVLVDFWATWCPECLKAMPKLIDIYRRYSSRGFTIVGVSCDQKLNDLQKFIDQPPITDPATGNMMKLPWPIIAEQYSTDKKEIPVSNYYGVNKLPTLFLIGRDGKVVTTALDINKLEAFLERELVPR